MNVLDTIAALQEAGVSFRFNDNEVRIRFPEAQRARLAPLLAELRKHRDEAKRILAGTTVEEAEHAAPGTTPQAIPSGAILLSLRYNGGGGPLVAVPVCWCCRETYKLDRCRERKGLLYAWLEPACQCLDVPQRIFCCGLCQQHCTCRRSQVGDN